MPHVGTRQAGIRPERVPKPVAGGAFTAVRKARPLSGPNDPRRIPAEPPRAPSGARYDPRRDGVAGQAGAVGIRPGRKATASLRGRAPGG